MKANINKISDIEYKNPFTVPDNYFDNIGDEIMKNLPEREYPEPVKVTMWAKVKPWIYMAAMFVGAYFMLQVLVKTSDTNIGSEQKTDQYWSEMQITEDEFYDYIEGQLINDGYYDYMYNQVSF